MTGKSDHQTSPRTMRGFQRTASLLQTRIRKASESRGFAVTRLLTHWSEIVGDQTAAIARPVGVSYGKGGIGATLTLLTTGAQAPMLQAELPKIKDKVNACYGYAAISRVRITQTAPTGFAEGQAVFQPAPRAQAAPSPDITRAAKDLTGDARDGDLRRALELLAQNVLSKSKTPE